MGIIVHYSQTVLVSHPRQIQDCLKQQAKSSSPEYFSRAENMLAAQQPSAKFLLHTFLDRAGKGLKPTYTTSDAKNAQGLFECTCTLPSVTTTTGHLESQSFMGEGPSKNLSSAMAAESAWAFAQGTKAHEAFHFKRSKQDLWSSIASALTPEASVMKPALYFPKACTIAMLELRHLLQV